MPAYKVSSALSVENASNESEQEASSSEWAVLKGTNVHACADMKALMLQQNAAIIARMPQIYGARF